MINPSEFNDLVKKYSETLRKRYALAFKPSADKQPIFCATLENDQIGIRMLYGPPEFHVELGLTNKSDGKRYSLGDLAQLSSVSNWLKAFTPNSNLSSVEAEIDWLCQFLEAFGDKLFLKDKVLLDELNIKK
jgi:hypothetical protein